MNYPEYRHHDCKRLAGIALTGFPLSAQKDATLALLEKACFSYMDISSMAIEIGNATSIEEVEEILEKWCKKKNEPLKALSEYPI